MQRLKKSTPGSQASNHNLGRCQTTSRWSGSFPCQTANETHDGRPISLQRKSSSVAMTLPYNTFTLEGAAWKTNTPRKVLYRTCNKTATQTYSRPSTFLNHRLQPLLPQKRSNLKRKQHRQHLTHVTRNQKAPPPLDQPLQGKILNGLHFPGIGDDI
jgi:hypothetical protein